MEYGRILMGERGVNTRFTVSFFVPCYMRDSKSKCKARFGASVTETNVQTKLRDIIEGWRVQKRVIPENPTGTVKNKIFHYELLRRASPP